MEANLRGRSGTYVGRGECGALKNIDSSKWFRCSLTCLLVAISVWSNQPRAADCCNMISLIDGIINAPAMGEQKTALIANDGSLESIPIERFDEVLEAAGEASERACEEVAKRINTRLMARELEGLVKSDSDEAWFAYVIDNTQKVVVELAEENLIRNSFPISVTPYWDASDRLAKIEIASACGGSIQVPLENLESLESASDGG